MFDAQPNIQPYMEYANSGFAAGFWGSFNLDGTYAEPDFFVSYSQAGFSFTVYDYHNGGGKDYFNYDSEETLHLIETLATYTLPTIPLYFTASVFVYGDDKKMEEGEATTDNNYSSYLELGYSFTFEQNSLDVAAGFVPMESPFYGTEQAAPVNISLTAARDIKITEEFSLPVFFSFVSNPNIEEAYMFFGLSL